MTFKKWYFVTALFLFVVEVLIALYMHDSIIRPYVGDFLVVIMIYCFVRAFLDASVLKIAIGLLIFAYLVEFFQYLDLVAMIGLKKSRLANVVLGNYFEWIDMIAYTLGIIAVFLFEGLKGKYKKRRLATM